MEEKYIRKVQTSVTNFLYCGDEYLLVRRASNKKIDPNRLNGIGGRLERGEDYLSAAIRETEEETGYEVRAEDVQFLGVVKLEGGYDEDWVMCFFKIKVTSKIIPHPDKNEGEFMWIHKDNIIDAPYEFVDDLTYTMKDIIDSKNIFFQTAQLNEQEKIVKNSLTYLKR